MSSVLLTGTMTSFTPWKAQQGVSLSDNAAAALVSGTRHSPQIGAIAANFSGVAAAHSKVPAPPIDSPVR
eukprot:CAMPEP_0114571994 /NCGR_PEP_ID=MMETSP0114-20121206/18040_1 /TAXON_ID=31324 /ORGANISM="Goniomonas sp, Strain m" /LENGTH=69 /DNA_ID=CAMNT_0001759145 /DNA_START=140 /DNA_END=349 /DNA_ORIENTATION=+